MLSRANKYILRIFAFLYFKIDSSFRDRICYVQFSVFYIVSCNSTETKQLQIIWNPP